VARIAAPAAAAAVSFSLPAWLTSMDTQPQPNVWWRLVPATAMPAGAGMARQHTALSCHQVSCVTCRLPTLLTGNPPPPFNSILTHAHTCSPWLPCFMHCRRRWCPAAAVRGCRRPWCAPL
jgi:hypothetical protein